jgi:hypothetical protein
MGGLETAIVSPTTRLFVTPMGTAVGNGALHVVDLRTGAPMTQLLATGNPAGYDLAVHRPLEFLFSVEDDGSGSTVLRGFSYAATGALTPLAPATLSLPGAPCAYVNRMGVDVDGAVLYVPTIQGVSIVNLSASVPNMSVSQSLATAPRVPTTNPVSFDDNGTLRWVVGTGRFDVNDDPVGAGFFSWDVGGHGEAAGFGAVTSDPSKSWVPAAGTEELAVVSDGTDAYVYYLLREPPPNTFFIKPSAIACVRFLGGLPPDFGVLDMPDTVGEPFANPAASGARVAFESSFGPPFIDEPPGGGEKLSIVYSPLDPLGSATAYGALGVPAPLGGRISTRGMDRPLWSRDGTRVMACTSHFPGAPNPGVPGIEVLNVPAGMPLDEFSAPHTVTPNLPFPNQSVVFPSVFVPRNPNAATTLDGLSFYGNVFHQGMASLAAATFGEIGQLQEDPDGFDLPPSVPGFPSVLPPSFEDAIGSTVPIPASFGARRTAFNFYGELGIPGLTMSAVTDDQVVVQPTGVDLLAGFGLMDPVDPIHVDLPAGWVTTTELLSL